MISTFTHLYESYKKASQGHHTSRPIQRFSFYLERELVLLQNDLHYRTYKPRAKRPFIVFEPKQRKIFESHFRDRVVHHALCSVVNPRFERRSLPKSYACRKGYGNLIALNNLRKTLNRLEDSGKRPWLLKIDIRKYFDSIPQDKLLSLIQRDTQDSEALWLAEKIISSYESTPGRGLPIGNLTSQIFANLYLNELDHYIVHKQKFKHLFRFMDDLIIVDTDQQRLKVLLGKIQYFCTNELGLEVHPNKIFLCEAQKGVEFLGFHIRQSKRTIKPANMARIKKRLRKLSRLLKNKAQTPEKIRQRIASWRGYALHGQVRFQLEHLISWCAFDPELQRICQNVFFSTFRRPPTWFRASTISFAKRA